MHLRADNDVGAVGDHGFDVAVEHLGIQVEVGIDEAHDIAAAVVDAVGDRSALAAVDFISAVPDVRVVRSRACDLSTGVVGASVVDRDYLIVRRNLGYGSVDHHQVVIDMFAFVIGRDDNT